MLVVKDLKTEIPGTNAHYFRLDQLSLNSKEHVLIYGYNNLEDSSLVNKFRSKGFKKISYLNVTMPTEFCSALSTSSDDLFDKVWTICPYSVAWLNEIKNTKKYNYVCYPFSHLDIPVQNEKKYDVCYHGGIHSQHHVDCLNVMKEFNYRYMSMTNGINRYTEQVLRQGAATDLNLTNEEKIKRISETKISVCYNFFPVRGSSDLENIKLRKDWWKNQAFSHVESDKIIPQFKSRFNEAAMSKTLNLVSKDHWNVIEHWYKEGEDFIYFDDKEDLKNKIENILNNYEDYEHVLENAYNKSMEHTSKNLYKKIKEDNK